jgi:hypothetical protein
MLLVFSTSLKKGGQYLNASQARSLYQTYEQITGGLIKMIRHPGDWLLS